MGRLIYILDYQHARYIYRGHTSVIRALMWLPHSQRIASGANNLQVWDALSGAHVQTFPAWEGIQAVAWSPDGKYLVSGNGDATATVWEVATGKQLLTYRGHEVVPNYSGRGVDDLAWSPDGTRLLSTGPDDTAQIWEALTGRTLLTLGTRLAYVDQVVWSPDGRQIAGYIFGGVRLWDATSGAPLTPFWKILSPSSHEVGDVVSLAWSPNGQYLAAAIERLSGGDQGVVIWEPATGRQMMTYQGHTDRILVVAWSPDSKRIASAGLDMTVRVWDALTGHTGSIYRGHMSFWQQFFTARTPEAPAQASEIMLPSPLLRHGALPGSASLLRPQDTSPAPPAVTALAWSPNGQYIASGGTDATVQIWQPG